MTDSEFVKKHLIHNKIIFPTNQYDNKMAGFQNYGPIGLIIKNNIINVWRNIFIKTDQDNIYEIDTNDFNYFGKKINSESIFQCASLSK